MHLRGDMDKNSNRSARYFHATINKLKKILINVFDNNFLYKNCITQFHLSYKSHLS